MGGQIQGRGEYLHPKKEGSPARCHPPDSSSSDVSDSNISSAAASTVKQSPPSECTNSPNDYPPPPPHTLKVINHRLSICTYQSITQTLYTSPGPGRIDYHSSAKCLGRRSGWGGAQFRETASLSNFLPFIYTIVF